LLFDPNDLLVKQLIESRYARQTLYDQGLYRQEHRSAHGSSSADVPRNVDFRSFFDVHRRSHLPLARLAVEEQHNLCQLYQHHYSTTMILINSPRSGHTFLVGIHHRPGRKQLSSCDSSDQRKCDVHQQRSKPNPARTKILQ
jgi:hypothetical protein